MLRSPLKVNRRFGGTHRFHLQVRINEGGMFLQKRQLTFNGLYGVISQRIVFFMYTAVRASNPALYSYVHRIGIA
jgi:hypothetical protein